MSSEKVEKQIKKLSLVFFIYLEGEKKFVLMGKYAPGKRSEGIRNGFGGKCEENESTLDCAVRETKEELDIEIKPEGLRLVGKIIDENMQVDVFVKISESKFEPPADNKEFVDTKWFDLDSPQLFVPEMFPDNDIVIESLTEKINELKSAGEMKELFIVDETKNKNPDLKLQKSKIHL